MSSILKALKKVEADAAKGVGAGPSEINAREVVGEKARRGILFRRVFVALVFVGCLLSGWWAFARYKPILGKWFSKPESEVPVAKKDAASRPQRGAETGGTGTAALKDRDARQRVASVPAARTPDQPAPRQEAPLLRQGVPPEQPFAKKVESPPKPSDPTQARQMVPAAPPPSESRISRAPLGSPASPVLARPLPRPTQAVSSAPEGESELQVQAIAWAEEPSKRIAVVNGKVVREGGTVDGFSVSRIGPDDVTFKRGDGEWRVPCVGGRPGGTSQ